MDGALIVALVAAVVGPALGYLLKVRQASGRIGASDAGALWQEGAAIRKEYAERIRVLEGVVSAQQDEIYRLQREVAGGGNA